MAVHAEGEPLLQEAFVSSAPNGAFAAFGEC